jgi:uncharacterized protein
MTITCVERLAITDSGCNALVFHYVRHSKEQRIMQIRKSFLFIWLAMLLLPAGSVWSQANLEVNTPAIAAIQGSMQKRFSEIQPHLVSGAVGLTRDGFVALRDANAVALPQRQQVNALVAAENQDRTALYREIARANNKPEWENDIRTTFAQRWIDKAQGGWYYQNSAGVWTRK